MLDKVLVTAFCLVAGVILLMQSLLLTVPFFKRLELDAIGHRHAMIMEDAGGLHDDKILKLQDALSERGFTVQSIEATSQAEYGEMLMLHIEASWRGPRFTSWLAIEEEETCFIYSSTLKNRVVYDDWMD